MIFTHFILKDSYGTVAPGRMGEVPVVDMWLAVASAVAEGGVQGST